MKKLILLIFLMSGIINLFGQNDFSDCSKAFPVCKTKTYYFNNIEGNGGQKEILKSNCTNVKLEETNSVWLKFKIKKAGISTFIITPNNDNDDIDFILYKSDNLNNYCNTKSDIRCMASGENIGSTKDQSRCMGVTGLNTRSMDKVEMNGCKFSDDNFLKFLNAKEGETYVLLVNNYNSKNGFSILFGGTSSFEILDECSDDKNKLAIQLLKVYPNPSKDIINLSISSKTDENVEISFLNLEGKKISTMKQNIQKGNQTIPFNISHLPSGNYFVKIENDNIHLIDKFIKE